MKFHLPPDALKSLTLRAAIEMSTIDYARKKAANLKRGRGTINTTTGHGFFAEAVQSKHLVEDDPSQGYEFECPTFASRSASGVNGSNENDGLFWTNGSSAKRMRVTEISAHLKQPRYDAKKQKSCASTNAYCEDLQTMCTNSYVEDLHMIHLNEFGHKPHVTIEASKDAAGCSYYSGDIDRALGLEDGRPRVRTHTTSSTASNKYARLDQNGGGAGDTVAVV